MIVLLIVTVSSMATEYDPLLLKTQASIFPKIILLDKDVESKLESDKIVISIVYSENDFENAIRLKNLIEDSYKKNLANKVLLVRLVDFREFEKENIATAYYLMQGEPDVHKSITSHAGKNRRVCFSYNYKDFENNALISLLIKEKTYIYLNKSAVHAYDIKFNPMFYKIVKVLE